jgi:hypothetical protein
MKVYIFNRQVSPSATRNLFEKRFLDLQKLFIKEGYGFHQGVTLMKTITLFVNNKKLLIKNFCGGPGGGFFKKNPLAAGGKKEISHGIR